MRGALWLLFSGTRRGAGRLCGREVREETQQTGAAVFRAGRRELLDRRLFLEHVLPLAAGRLWGGRTCVAYRAEGRIAHPTQPTVSEKVAECINAPDIAVTVTVDVMGVRTGAGCAPDEFPPQPVKRVRPTRVTGRISARRRLCRLLRGTKHRPTAKVDPEGNSPAVVPTAADIVDGLTVSVETMSPV